MQQGVAQAFGGRDDSLCALNGIVDGVQDTKNTPLLCERRDGKAQTSEAFEAPPPVYETNSSMHYFYSLLAMSCAWMMEISGTVMELPRIALYVFRPLTLPTNSIMSAYLTPGSQLSLLDVTRFNSSDTAI